MSDRRSTGGCSCGAVRYEAKGEPSAATLCHCESCRRATGAPVVAWVSWPAANFTWTVGEPAAHRSSPLVTREFCGGCGTPLTYRHDHHGDWIDVTVGSLDTPNDTPPVDHIWTADRLDWMTGLGRLPDHRGARSDDG